MLPPILRPFIRYSCCISLGHASGQQLPDFISNNSLGQPIWGELHSVASGSYTLVIKADGKQTEAHHLQIQK